LPEKDRIKINKEFEEYATLRENLRQMLEPPPQAQM